MSINNNYLDGIKTALARMQHNSSYIPPRVDENSPHSLNIDQNIYNSATPYNKWDVVYYNGASYIALKSTLGNNPINREYWAQFLIPQYAILTDKKVLTFI